MTAPNTDPTAELSPLRDAVAGLRAALDRAVLPLEIPGVADVRAARTALADQIDDYILPRLSSLDAPLLAVVGGSTGAGKSTLVNSVIGEAVSRAGVLRPTTSAPVLVHHPDDARWFTDQRILPGLGRVTGQVAPDAPQDPSSVRLVPSAALSPGLAVLDAPDIDSVVTRNRDLAGQLLAAADMWIFVTTAARYADAVPWELLRQASERGTSVAIVLDRVPPGAGEEIRAHLGTMLTEQGLGGAPVFTVDESPLDASGLLPAAQIGPLRDWLQGLAGDAQARAAVVRQTLTGALDALEARSAEVAAAVDAQSQAAAGLAREVGDAYGEATEAVSRDVSDGTLLRGEVLARWQEFVGTGEFFRQVESTVSRLRDRITSFIRGRRDEPEPLGEALHSGAATLIEAEAQGAATRAVKAWRTSPGGAPLVERHPELGSPGPGFGDSVERLVRDWQAGIFEMVRHEGKDRRAAAKGMAYGVNGLGLALMLVTFASTGGITGAEVGIAGGSAVVAQKVLEAIFGDETVRRLAAKAREDLVARVGELYDSEAHRFDEVLSAALADGEAADGLRRAAAAVKAAR